MDSELICKPTGLVGESHMKGDKEGKIKGDF